MLVDGKLNSTSVPSIVEAARHHERLGFGGLWSSESKHDPFLPLALAAEHTSTIELGTSIAVAFARTPMTVGYTAWDLQRMSDGRFVLGLGSQVKPHIERRFSMPWTHPAGRMREFVLALRAIWKSWQDGSKLDFDGEFYRHVLMPPFFRPEPQDVPTPKIVVAAVGDAMCEIVGETCDGIFLHPFTTTRFIREVTLPALARGRERADGSSSAVEVFGLPMIATGEDEEATERAVSGVRKQIAFYGSTPAYRGVLDLHGWEDLGVELHALSTSKEPSSWEKMATLIDDDVLTAFAVVGPPDEVGAALLERYGELMDRLQFYAPYEHTATLFDPVITDIVRRAGSASPHRPDTHP